MWLRRPSPVSRGKVGRRSTAVRATLGDVTLRDYVLWLNRYDDPSSPLSWRLRQVQDWLSQELDRRSGPMRVLSACAGDGRDIIDVLERRQDAERVDVVLVEAHPRVADLARSRARAAGLAAVRVRTSDAGDSASYADAVPADLVLLVGLLGNISHDDVSAVIAASPQLCAAGATLIWSRGRDTDDLNDLVRAEFAKAEFTELDYMELNELSRPALGRMRYDGKPVPLQLDQHLFTFWR